VPLPLFGVSGNLHLLPEDKKACRQLKITGDIHQIHDWYLAIQLYLRTDNCTKFPWQQSISGAECEHDEFLESDEAFQTTQLLKHF
jgi:hypothetical protein